MSITNQKLGTLEYLTADGISVPHCFTTRLGGVSTGHLDSLNIGMHRGDDPENVAKNHEILANALGYDVKKCVLSHQVHTDIVRVVTEKDCLGLDHHLQPECDGLITNTPGLALVIFTADCTPILLHDPVTGAVGAVHAGWRGTVSGIAAECIKKMCSLGAKAENIRVAVGPAIHACCYEVGEDFVQSVIELAGEGMAQGFIKNAHGKLYADIVGMNRRIMLDVGIAIENIDICHMCTCCHPELFFSHRYSKGLRGTMLSVISLGK